MLRQFQRQCLVDNSQRALLHARLDSILHDRDRIEEPAPANALQALLGQVTPGVSSELGARAILRDTIEFAKDVLGDSVRFAAFERTYKENAEQRQVLRGWLATFLPLINAPTQSSIFGLAPYQELTIFQVLDALSALDAGEIQPLFEARKGKNRRANRWSLARAKLEALLWKKRLVALGHAEKSANYQVTVAFGEQWDTIRKWKAQCEQVLGPGDVTWQLEYAGSTRDIYVSPPRGGLFGGWKPDPDAALRTAGSAYRSEVQRSAELSKRKCRAAA